MTECQIVLDIVLFGGAADGKTLSLESHKEKVKVGDNIYCDSYFVDSNGRAIFYAQKGQGRMTKNYIKKLFADEEIF